jgi:small subunit ribosomal protein S4e
MTGYVKNRLEAKYALSRGLVKVCGKIRKDEGFPVGLMDTVEFIPLNKAFSVIPSLKDFLALHPIRDEEKTFKLCRIENKTTIKGGKIQVNLHDGRNILINVGDSEQLVTDVYKTFDVLKLEMPSAKILGHIKFGIGVPVVIIGGANTGHLGRVINIEVGSGLKPTMVTIERKDGSTFQSPIEYVFAVGDKEPWISLPE